MKNGNKILIAVVVILLIVIVFIRKKQQVTPTYSLTDLFNQAKSNLATLWQNKTTTL
jgi:hypothetical protein